MAWHTAHLAGHKSHKSQGYYDEGIQCLVLLRPVILSLTGHHNLLGSFSKRKNTGLVPESESQRMEPTFVYTTFFLASPDTPVVSHRFRLWSWNTLTQNTCVCVGTHIDTYTFCDSLSSLPNFFFFFTDRGGHRYSGIIRVSESLNPSINNKICLQGFLKSCPIRLQYFPNHHGVLKSSFPKWRCSQQKTRPGADCGSWLQNSDWNWRKWGKSLGHSGVT